MYPRKNISLTLISTYENFDRAYAMMRDKIDKMNLFSEKFENYQIQTLYQMSKYFFKYLQNYFQTKSIIFMKAWDSITSEYSRNCNLFESSFKLSKNLYIRDHELKFYILSVNRMGYDGTFRDIGLSKQDIVIVLKSIVNKALLYDSNLVTKNYQSIFTYSNDLTGFLDAYNPKSYFTDYSSEKIGDFERRLKYKILSQKELETDGDISFPRKEIHPLPVSKPEKFKENYKDLKEPEHKKLTNSRKSSVGSRSRSVKSRQNKSYNRREGHTGEQKHRSHHRTEKHSHEKDRESRSKNHKKSSHKHSRDHREKIRDRSSERPSEKRTIQQQPTGMISQSELAKWIRLPKVENSKNMSDPRNYIRSGPSKEYGTYDRENRDKKKEIREFKPDNHRHIEKRKPNKGKNHSSKSSSSSKSKSRSSSSHSKRKIKYKSKRDNDRREPDKGGRSKSKEKHKHRSSSSSSSSSSRSPSRSKKEPGEAVFKKIKRKRPRSDSSKSQGSERLGEGVNVLFATNNGYNSSESRERRGGLKGSKRKYKSKRHGYRRE